MVLKGGEKTIFTNVVENIFVHTLFKFYNSGDQCGKRSKIVWAILEEVMSETIVNMERSRSGFYSRNFPIC